MGKVKAKTLQEKMGFMDRDLGSPVHDEMVVWAMSEVPKVLMKKYPQIAEFSIKLEHPVFASGSSYSYKQIVGFLDIFISVKKFTKPMDNCPGLWGVEVKPSIPSLGELIRQINTYKAHRGSMETVFIVVSPDDKWKELLISQGIGFIKYELTEE